MNIIENDRCLITLCPVSDDPSRENLVNLNCRETEEILVTNNYLFEKEQCFYKNAINLSLYDDMVIYKEKPYRIIHMLTLSNDSFLRSYQHKYKENYKVSAA